MLVLVLVVRDLLDILVIIMGKLGKLVLKGWILVVEPLQICDILGGELLLVEGRVGHAAMCCVGIMSAGRRDGRGRRRGGQRRGAATEKATGRMGLGRRGERGNDWRNAHFGNVRLTDINLGFGGGDGQADDSDDDARRSGSRARDAVVEGVVDDDGATSRGQQVGGERWTKSAGTQAQPHW